MKTPRVIVLEGPDGAGKSTLAVSLARSMSLVLVHFTAPAQGTSFDDTCRAHLKDVRASGKSVVFDRFHLSERVYGPIARGVDTMSDGFEITMWKEVRPLVVLCLPPYQVAFQNWAKRKAENGEMIVKSEQYEAVYLAYENIRTTLPILQYDYTRDRAADVLDRLVALGFTA